jgi:hypothetical protein
MRAEWDVVRPGTARSDASSQRLATARNELAVMRDGTSLDITRSNNGQSPARFYAMDGFI